MRFAPQPCQYVRNREKGGSEPPCSNSTFLLLQLERLADHRGRIADDQRQCTRDNEYRGVTPREVPPRTFESKHVVLPFRQALAAFGEGKLRGAA